MSTIPSFTRLGSDFEGLTCSFLPGFDLARYSAVNRRLHRIANTPQLWKGLAMRDFNLSSERLEALSKSRNYKQHYERIWKCQDLVMLTGHLKDQAYISHPLMASGNRFYGETIGLPRPPGTGLFGVWDLENGTGIATPQDPFSSFDRISQSGSEVYTFENRTVTAWNETMNQHLISMTLPAHFAQIGHFSYYLLHKHFLCVRSLQDNSEVLQHSISRDAPLQVWDLRKWEVVANLPLASEAIFLDCDADRLVMSSALKDSEIEVRDLQSGSLKLLYTLPPLRGTCLRVTEGRVITWMEGISVSATKSRRPMGNLLIWDLRDGKLLHTVGAYFDMPKTYEISANRLFVEKEVRAKRRYKSSWEIWSLNSATPALLRVTSKEICNPHPPHRCRILFSGSKFILPYQADFAIYESAPTDREKWLDISKSIGLSEKRSGRAVPSFEKAEGAIMRMDRDQVDAVCCKLHELVAGIPIGDPWIGANLLYGRGVKPVTPNKIGIAIDRYLESADRAPAAASAKKRRTDRETR